MAKAEEHPETSATPRGKTAGRSSLHPRRMGAVLVACALTGCASPSGNMRVGSEQSYQSLQAQREAVRSVSESDDVPSGAVAIGPVDASRCHRFQGDIEPTREILLDDLKAAAYGRGADGIAGISIVKESGILRNCWYIFTARATMYRSPPR